MSLDVSQMMDGELDDDAARRLLAKLREDEQARQAWEQYHVIGDALRGTTELKLNGVSAGSGQLQQRVFAALAQEPTVLAPPAPRAVPARWVRYGVAAAATLAAFGLFSWFAPLEQAAQPQQVVSADKQWLRGVAPAQAQIGSAMTSTQVGSADDPYIEAHFDVSPTIRPSVMRAGWQLDERR